ncbi:DUF4365 domain-containing protein [Nocardia exalbida]|uniref:DUF4365 domain-containing protein n=1 Tax=Nocardia exalbida TaxID=290231 RepID=UPI0012F6B52A|nr:DUF4365 domain-containing protein [Nocardia exalbida]
MTKRPRSHEIASLAVAAVSKMWIEQGAAVEEIRNDYGDDLLIQTSWKGEMDESRIWVQVKGHDYVTLSSKTPAPRSLRVSSGHAFRWANTSDLVVIAQWDVHTNTGWYTLPQYSISSHSLLQSRRENISLRFPADHILDSASVRRIIWQSRLRSANLLVSSLRFAHLNSFESPTKESAVHFHNEAVAVIFMLWLKLGASFDDDGRPCGEFHDLVCDSYDNLCDPDDELLRDPPERLAGAIALSLLKRLDDLGEIPIEEILLLEMSEVMIDIYEGAYANTSEWEDYLRHRKAVNY